MRVYYQQSITLVGAHCAIKLYIHLSPVEQSPSARLPRMSARNALGTEAGLPRIFCVVCVISLSSYIDSGNPRGRYRQ